MSVRNVSARTPLGLCAESSRRPLYPTRPDPTRPIYTWSPSHHDVAYVRRAARLGMMGEAKG